ncbi:MAG: hypothetical protein ACMUEM_05450 [Flavobacteriales bacterium AspAUS03]
MPAPLIEKYTVVIWSVAEAITNGMAGHSNGEDGPGDWYVLYRFSY